MASEILADVCQAIWPLASLLKLISAFLLSNALPIDLSQDIGIFLLVVCWRLHLTKSPTERLHKAVGKRHKFSRSQKLIAKLKLFLNIVRFIRFFFKD